MYLYLSILLGVVLAAAIPLLIISGVKNNRVVKTSGTTLTAEELEKHARKVAVEHLVSRKRNLLNWPIPRMNDNYNFIVSVYKDLNEDVEKKRAIPPSAEWLLDNFYIVEEQVKGIRGNFSKESYSRLPILKSGALKGYARVFAISMDFIAHTDGRIEEDTLLNYLRAYQSFSDLYDREIWAVPTFIRIALIEEIRQICEKIKATRSQWNKADEIINSWLDNEDANTDRVIRLFNSELKTGDGVNPSFVEHLFYRLRRAGRGYARLLKYMDESLSKYGTNIESITQKEHNSQAVSAVSIGNCITSLKFVSTLDWMDILMSVSSVEKILRQDPDGTYPLMDLSSRNYYRSRIEKFALDFGISEFHIAGEAVELAMKSCLNDKGDSDEDCGAANAHHVGYYLIGKGIKSLKEKLSNETHRAAKAAGFFMGHPGAFYFSFIGIITVLLAAVSAYYSYRAAKEHYVLMAALAGLGVLVPASEIALVLVNWISCKIFRPSVFPRLELKNGIPESLSTMVVIPALMSDEKRVKGLLENLESHYLANKEKNLYFGLIGDLKDSPEAVMPEDEKIINAALEGIKGLNEKYAGDRGEIFYFFYRQRIFNERHNKWMGWERKRGALAEFDDMLLSGNTDSFAYSSNSPEIFSRIKYVITLDADTILPIDGAKRMIGTMAHPLNRPVVDKGRGVVVDGYGLMQPRISFDIESSNKTLFSRIFTGQEGMDPYACAVSDVYQDLFGEGIFTGKGIYDLRVFHNVLKDAIPENTILSHDLLEGSYVRTALITDLELVDSYPSRYNSFASRLHRWVRGDWQLLPWLSGRISDKSGKRIPNPLSFLSRWKIFDNLRRSLVAPSLIILLILGFSLLPGNGLYWLCFALLVLSFPILTAVTDLILSRRLGNSRTKRHIPVISGFKAGAFQILLMFVFLPYQGFLMANAIWVTLIRVLFTRKNMLEWVTAADSEKGQKNSISSYWRKMYVSVAVGLVIVFLAFACKPSMVVPALLLLTVWGIAPYVAYWVGKDEKDASYRLTPQDAEELRRIARKTWRYFEEFANFRNHYLAPDNYQEDPPRGVAHRTSPTNIGLGLLAILSARDLGYVGTGEMADMITDTIATMEKMEKWNGHLYNWYDTRSLRPLRPAYISTVDSGNLVCYLIILVQGLKEYLESPVVEGRHMDGIADMLKITNKADLGSYNTTEVKTAGQAGMGSVDISQWYKLLLALTEKSRVVDMRRYPWEAKAAHMIKMFKKELMELMPWIGLLEEVPEGLVKNSDEELEKTWKGVLKLLKSNAALISLPGIYREAAQAVGSIMEKLKGTKGRNNSAELEWLERLRTEISSAIENTERLIGKFKDLIERTSALSEGMKFTPLYVEKKQLFSIGFNIEENRLTNSFYDLLASEARQTSYISIARGEIPSQHWFKLGRALTVVDRYKGLVSWTGTMFEYLMPLLIMKSYRNTLLDETYSFVVRSQKKYGKMRNMPWGASESGFYSLDINLDYQYKAIGIPWLGLKRGLIQDAVTAPYATFLALLADPEGALENIRVLKANGMEGPYGFYEAADYTPERLPFGEKRAIVRSFMAHHQGMSLLALNNILNDNIMQKRFHNDPVVKAARLLLQEKVPTNVVFTKETKERIAPYKDIIYKEKGPVREFDVPDPILPRVHVLSNGNYSVMVTDRGTGYSTNKLLAVTRWREDITLDRYGMFFYLRNVDTNAVWSAAYAPLNKIPDRYGVIFTADKARFERRDGDIETVTEIVVASGDNAEIRRISLKNYGDKPCTIEVTSYFEVVLAPQAADLAHPAFSNLFVKTDFLPEKKCIIANRRPRSETDRSPWIANTVVAEGEEIGDIQFETDRMQFLGRGHDVSNPAAIERNKPLSNTMGPVLDPVMSFRLRVKIEPGKTARLSFLTIVSETDDALSGIVEKYSKPEAVEGAFKLALIRSQVEARYLNRKDSEIELYQDMISNIIFLSPLRRLDSEIIAKNRKGQSSLWAYGISGDLPIVLVVLRKTDEVDILVEMLKAHEYWRIKGLKVDLVVLCDEENSYTNPLNSLLSDIIQSGCTHDIINKPGGVFMLDRNNMPVEDVNLIYAVARIVLRGESGTIVEQVKHQIKSPGMQERQYGEIAPEYPVSDPEVPELHYPNGIGGFSKDGSEYVIRLEKSQNTPAPWSNVISNPDFGFLVSEAGSGYTWSENSRENKVTPWSNDPVSDLSGEVLYITDSDTGELWTITSLPVREEGAYLVKHGFGYSVFEHSSHGIEQSMTQFVPVNDSIKISMINLKNISKQARNLTLTYYVRPVLGVSEQVTAMHIKTHINENGAILMENPYNEEFPGRICFMDCTEKERSFTCDRKEFFGAGNISRPEGLKNIRLLGAAGTGYDPCAALQVSIAIKSGESREIVFLLGMAQERQKVDELTARYRKISESKDALAKVKGFWKDKLQAVQVETPDLSMNLMMNGWLMYQVISCRVWARSAFYQSGGAFGFRDQLQDCLSLMHVWPEITRNQILFHARHQFVEGDVQHWWHEPEGKGTRTRFSDDLLWLPYAVSEYIKVTGDWNILKEEVPFLEDEVLKDFEDERYGKPRVSEVTASVYEHCLRAIEISLKFGSHGLPLMGSGDWNDGMSTVGNLGTGESVWLGWFLYSVLEKFSVICKDNGESDRAKRYSELSSKISEAIEKNAWDGSWYRRAYFDSGIPLGSVQNSECKIDAIAQAWAVISGAGDPQRALQAMGSLEDYLVQRDEGLIKLLAPPFDEGDLEPGYIKGYVPGIRENGGQYTHAAAWVIIAFVMLGDGDKALELFELINPVNHTRTPIEYCKYKVEPYVMAADVYAVPPHTGRGGWTWYTGSAGWIYTAGLQYILGFRKKGDMLAMDPCIPKKWKEYKVKYKHFDTSYEISVKNPNGVNSGVKEMSLDGKALESDGFRLVNDGSAHFIEVVLGK